MSSAVGCRKTLWRHRDVIINESMQTSERRINRCLPVRYLRDGLVQGRWLAQAAAVLMSISGVGVAARLPVTRAKQATIRCRCRRRCRRNCSSSSSSKAVKQQAVADSPPPPPSSSCHCHQQHSVPRLVDTKWRTRKWRTIKNAGHEIARSRFRLSIAPL